jgi:SAM-dependent methyltransferase
MNDPLSRHYDAFYRERDPAHVYPVEFVVRALLGNYPRHQTRGLTYIGKRVLDLGFGDGRNMPLLHQLGMVVHGVEISQKICDRTGARMKRLGIDATLKVGHNREIPFDDAFFDVLVACHSCYYVETGTRFDDNLREIARILKPRATFIFSAPMNTSYILQGAHDLGDGHMQIRHDPYGVRVGAILKTFASEAEIADSLSPLFMGTTIGSCRNDFWGIEEHVWIAVCHRI